MSGRCKDCRWWVRRSDADKDGWAECEQCVSFKKPHADKIFEDEYPCIMTGPDFGCVHFQRREDIE